MEGQIGGKSGPGVPRMRPSGHVGALGRVLVEAWGGQGEENLLLGRSSAPGIDLGAHASRGLINKATWEPLSHSLVTPCKAGVGGYNII